MAVQNATYGNLEDIQKVIIAEMRYTAEYSSPCWNTCEQFTLGQGEKQITVPKLGQITVDNLVDGIDITASKDFDISTVDLTTSEVGAKIIYTDKLARQSNTAVAKMAGRILGDGMTRKREEDVIAIFTGFSGQLGGDNTNLGLNNCSAEVAYAKANKFPSPIVILHHPYAVAFLARNAAGVGTSYFAGVMQGLPEEKLRNFWKIIIDGVNVLETGNIAKLSGYDSGYGAIYSKSAIACIQSLAPTTEIERDASLRAHEMVMVTDYGVFELDDSYGARLQHEIGALTTSATA